MSNYPCIDPIALNKTLSDLIHEQALKYPDRIAAICLDKTLTYGELEAKSNQLAHYIQAKSLQQEKIIGIYQDRSLDVIVSMLAVLKTGAAYLPLDPTFPKLRLAYMMQQAEINLVLTHDAIVNPIQNSDIQWINLNAEAQEISQQAQTNCPVNKNPQDLAYVIFTSGSTGKPKGVMIRHLSLVNLLLSMQQSPGIELQDHLLALTTIAFDISGLEIWLPLISGAKLTIATQQVSKHPPSLAHLINENQITLIQATPATLHLLVYAQWKPQRALKILCGGERLPKTLAADLLAMGHALWNVYGPTETTIWSTVKQVLSSEGISVGKPIANTELCILDEDLQLLPPNAVGDLYIGGLGLAQGYINEPNLTKAQFIPHPFKPNATLYKTGDLARFLPNGEVDILGRLDDQIKINGHRIEIYEIENALKTPSIVQDAVVLALPLQENNQSLAAYIRLNKKQVNQQLTKDLESERVRYWESIYSDVYRRKKESPLGFNTSGWTSSYTQKAIASSEMQEWVNHTVSRIKSLKPRRILEIGCGTGMLLAQLAGSCETYVGVDLSAEALNEVNQLIQSRPDLNHVQLHQSSIAELQQLDLQSFDVIVINSVIQYFPSAEYLLNGIKKVLTLLERPGKLFIGDVRDLTSLTNFHASKLRHQANDSLTVKAFKDQLHFSLLNEEELVLSPKFFTSLADQIPDLVKTDILIKTSKTHNEMTCFRFDVILSINLQEMVESQRPLWYFFHDLDLSPSSLVKLLQSQPGQRIGICHIPNNRLSECNQFKRWLDEQNNEARINAFKPCNQHTLEPCDFIAAASAAHLRVQLSWHNAYADGSFDALFYPPELENIPWFGKDIELNLECLANNPMQKELHLHAQSMLRSHLLDHLPSYMIPSHFIFLDQFPLTPNQKLDKRALPLPDTRQLLTRDYIAPSNDLEKQLVDAWEQALNVHGIGVTDNYFSLGGDSIRSMQIAAILYPQGVLIESQWIFTSPTIRELAVKICQPENMLKKDSQVKITPFALSELTDTELLALQKELPKLEDVYPLSPMQSGILYSALKQEGSYLIQGIFTLVGHINAQRFLEAWQVVVNNNPVLRSGIIWEHYAKPFQYVLSQCDFPYTWHDWTHYGESEQQAKLEIKRQSILNAGIKLNEAPLFRLDLIQCHEKRYYCVLTCQHLIVDGWSLSLIMQEVIKAYANPATIAQKPNKPYRDYIAWFAQQDEARSQRFWSDYLRDFTEPSMLQFQHAKGYDDLLPYQTHTLGLGEGTSQKLSALAKQHQVTLSTLIQVAWAILLGHYSQLDDVVFGVTLSGRAIGLQQANEIIGPFIETMPVRILLGGEKTFAQLLDQLQQQTPHLLEHAFLGLAKIQASLASACQMPLFDTLLVFENEAFDLKPNTNQDPFSIAEVLWHEQTEYPLTLSITLAQQITFDLAYQTSHYNPEDMVRLADNLITTLEWLVENPSQTLKHGQILSPTQYHTLVNLWNGTHYENEKSYVHQLFEEQSQLTPDAIAILCEGCRWTYDEINKKANQLAYGILNETQGKDCMVAIALDRSYELVIGLLGILKAGATYVVLDPSYPLERLQFILEDTKAPILLSTSHPRLVPPFQGKILHIDAMNNTLPTSNPSIAIQDTTTAYVMYTSGSTGQPKGVLNSHRAILNRLLWTLRAYPIDAADKFLQLAAVGFDISFWEMLFPLSAGATLCIAPPDKHKDMDYIAHTIYEQKITILHFVPSLLELFLEYADVAQCHSIKQVICGGELMSHALRDQFFAKLSAKLYHAYGPTEAAISVTHLDCDEDSLPDLVPIGKPIANTQLYILSKYLHPMPVHAFGELYISGICLADGYLNRPELTAQQFVNNPFKPGEKMYKTGDIACYLPEGSIVFHGRKDNQVKLYGHRIELGEIESIVRKHPQVRDALLLLREDIPQHPYLVAYLLTNVQQTPELISELRSELEAKLPDYMMPGAFECLLAWPLTPNGKIDRKALPMPTRKQKLDKKPQALSEVEQQLSTIWCKILGLDAVAVDDNFFSLGGDSILSIQLVSLARQIGIVFSIKDIFRAPTISGLAALAGTKPKNDSSSLSPNNPAALFDLTPIQSRFFKLALQNKNHFNQTVCLDLDPSISTQTLKNVLHFLVAHHDMLRVRFTNQHNLWKQYIAPLNEALSFESISMESLQKEKQEDQINQAQQEINLEQGILLVVRHFVWGENQRSKLVIILHHLCVDTVSWSILLEDLDLLLKQSCKKTPLSLPYKTSSYQDWSNGLWTYANSVECKQKWDYWRNLVTSPHPPCGHLLPISGEKGNTFGTMKTFKAPLAKTHSKIDAELLLLTALAQAYCQWSSQSVLFANLEGHGREDIQEDLDLSRTIGWFTSIYPIHIQLDAPTSAVSSLKQVKESLHSIPNKGLDFALLAVPADYPQPKVCINYLGKKFSDSQRFHHFNLEPLEHIQTIDPKNRREHELEIETVVKDQIPQVEISYNALQFQDESIQQFMELVQGQYANLIDYCAVNSLPYVPSDFPLCPVDQAALDELSADKPIDDLYPLTFAQAGMLFQTQLNAINDVYFVQSVYLLNGEVALDRLHQAWNAVLQHHPILRTGFIWNSVVEPLQFVLQDATLPWEVLDWSCYSIEEAERQLNLHLQQERQKPFVLSEPPLFRLTLIGLQQNCFYMIWTQHHILIDGWCLSILLTDVLNAYQSISESKPIKLPHYPAFSNYIAWLQQTDLKQAETFWKDYLLGFDNPTRLQLKLGDTPSDAEYKQLETLLSPEETKAILQFIKTHQCTLNTFLQCAWGLLLSFYLDSQDVVFGITQSGRSIELAGVENMLGLLINTLPLRFCVEADDTVLSLLTRLQDEMSNLYQYSYTPLSHIPKWVGIHTEKGLFDTLFVFENYPFDDSKLAHFKQFKIKEHLWLEKTEYSLTITILPGEQLGFLLSYQTNQLDEEACVDIAQRLRLILLNMVNNPTRVMKHFPKGDDTELPSKNQGPMDYPKLCVHELFEQQVHLTPDAIAIQDDFQSLTYQQLNIKANQLAHCLISLQLPPQACIALCLDRNIQIVIALLAVMKAAATYVPLEPHYPQERMRYILEEVRSPLLLTQTHHQSKFSHYPQAMLCIDDEEALSSFPVSNPNLACAPTQRVYVLFTSGSTGKPKGVMVSHQNLINFLTDMQYRLQITVKDAWLALTTITFDIAGLELYLPLISGAKLILASKEQTRDADLLKARIESSKCTIMQATPATWRMLLDANWQRPNHLQVLVGGEALPLDLVHALNQDNDFIWNLYGPTETTIWSMAAKLFGKVDRVHLGEPIANTRIYLLDKWSRLTPQGMPGEICIAGHGLALGYLNQPELTAERFVDIALGKGIETVYKTGDIGRFLKDGRLEYLGRSDDQIKRHGYRIELGEIALCLKQHPHIKEAIVLPHRDHSDQYLVAHLTTENALKTKPVDFSLFYFSAYQTQEINPYQLIIESVKYADEAGFKAVWTPERHFHEVGGQFPNPSVLSAALATLTKNLHLRAGSVVLPLHHPLRVAEEWSLVDNLSNGRVGIALASGWNPKDFALYPEHYETRKDILFSHLQHLQTLWQGGSMEVLDGQGRLSSIFIYPKPRQAKLPIWITAAGNPDTFIEAGKLGANLLTHLLGQTISSLAEKIALYRKALQDHGFDPMQSVVTIMLHAFVSDSRETALEISKQPFCNYLKAHLSLESMAQSVGRSHLVANEQDEDELILAAFERYSKTSALIGSLDDCLDLVKQLKGIGINEIACLVDFGIEADTILAHLPYLTQLMHQSKELIELDEESLRDHLSQHLPEYMHPQAFLAHQQFPLTLNGKIDRKQLASHHQQLNKTKAIQKGATNEVELRLIKIWSEVLAKPIDSIHDNFFHLGGHSLLVTQAISRIRREFDLEIPLRALFDSPTVAELSQALSQWTKRRRIDILPAAESATYPLSFSQLRSWYLHQLEPNKPLHNTLFILRMQGQLKIAYLQQALQELIRRHPMLRMTLCVQEGMPAQIIHEKMQVSLGELTWASLDASEKEAALLQLQQEELYRPFDLITGPLLRGYVIDFAKEEWILMICQHHIIVDGWSRQVFIGDLAALYNALLDHKPASLPALALQYVDFAVWQRASVNQAFYLKQLSYWQEQLADLPHPLQLPYLDSLPQELDYQGVSHVHVFSEEISQKLKQYANQQDVTLFMLLLSLFGLLLHRYCGEDDLILGTPIANRHYPGVEGLIGFFVNTLALRMDFSENPLFSSLLKRVKAMTLNAYENQDLPFDQLVEALKIPREPNRHPIFQILFAMQDVGNLDAPFQGIHHVETDSGLTIAQFDLTVSLKESHRIQLQFDYATQLFAADTILAMARHFEVLTLDLLQSGDKPIGQLSLITHKDNQHLLALSHVPAIASNHTNLVSLMQAHLQQSSDHLAIRMENASMTYQELNQQSNQLARFLIAAGIKPNAMVAVCLERGIDYVLALLAILKVGATFLPLDPDFPENRLSYMLQDSSTSFVLTHSTHQMLFKSYPMVLLNEQRQAIQQHSSDDLKDIPLKSDSIAYVIYTSGTTGKPKGVPITHRAILQRMLGCQDIYPLNPKDNFLHLFSFVFDGSVISTWWPLCYGAGMILPSKETLTSPVALAGFLKSAGATVIFGTPSLLKALAGELKETSHRKSLCILSGGEKLNYEVISLLMPFAKEMHNLYGPTECAVLCTAHRVEPKLGLPASVIGKPIANTQAYILDKYQQLLPMGLIGELCIGGESLATGYLNQPTLTEDKFIPDPFSNHDSARMYKTGDFARFLADGTIDYIGRRDKLIKLRGYRIELDEVAHVIRQHPQVNTAVVCIAELNTSRQRLLAFIVPQQMQMEDSFLQDMKVYMARHLPDYMRPSSLYLIHTLPLTTQGKIDESQLLELANRTLTTSQYQTPRSLTEYKLMTIWQNLLDVPQVHLQSNFFELGGHSLLIVKMMADIQREFNLSLPLNYLFKYPTLASLAQQLEAVYGEEDILLPIQTKGEKTPLILIHPASGLSFAYLSMKTHFPDRPIYALSNPKYYDKGGKFRAVEDMANHYCEIIQQKLPFEVFCLGGWSFGGLVAYEMAKQLKDKQCVEQLLLFDTHNASHPSFEESTVEERLKQLQELELDAHTDYGQYYLQELIHNEQLARSFEPKSYPGKTILFKARGSDAARTWQHVMHAQFRVVDVDGTHQQLFNQTHAEGLCFRLRNMLEEV